MNTPLCTFRQAITAIRARKYVERKRQEALIGWQTRTLATMLAATGMGSNEEAVAAASTFAFDSKEAAYLRSLAAHRGHEEPIPHENKAGSYESLMTAMGRAPTYE